MSDPDSAEEKSFEPTDRKLEQAREKGEIPRSNDLNAAVVYASLTLIAAASGPWIVKSFGTALMMFHDFGAQLPSMDLSGQQAASIRAISNMALMPLLPLLIVPGIAVVLIVIARGHFLVTAEKLKPKISRISPISGAKNKFGRAGLFEFAKSFVKMTVYGICLAAVLIRHADDLLALSQMRPGQVVAILGQLCLEMFIIVTVVAASIAAVDVIWQQAEHRRKNMMTRKEITDEQKTSEGDPHMKQKRRQRGIDIAMNQMLADVPKADVVIVNPTHFAVALRWDKQPGKAPVCVAKGVDEIAARIRETAMASAIPIHSDPPTARAIYATVDLGREIDQEHYRAVAVAIRFADVIRKKQRSKF